MDWFGLKIYDSLNRGLDMDWYSIQKIRSAHTPKNTESIDDVKATQIKKFIFNLENDNYKGLGK